MKMKVFCVFALIVLTVTGWLSAGRWLGAPSAGIGIALAVSGWLFALLVVRRVSPSVWIGAGFVVLAGLFFPATVLEKIFSPGGPGSTMELTVLSTVSAALLIAALLIGSDLNPYEEWRKAGVVEDAGSQAQPERAGRTAAVCFVLSALLIAMLLHTYTRHPGMI